MQVASRGFTRYLFFKVRGRGKLKRGAVFDPISDTVNLKSRRDDWSPHALRSKFVVAISIFLWLTIWMLLSAFVIRFLVLRTQSNISGSSSSSSWQNANSNIFAFTWTLLQSLLLVKQICCTMVLRLALSLSKRSLWRARLALRWTLQDHVQQRLLKAGGWLVKSVLRNLVCVSTFRPFRYEGMIMFSRGVWYRPGRYDTRSVRQLSTTQRLRPRRRWLLASVNILGNKVTTLTERGTASGHQKDAPGVR